MSKFLEFPQYIMELGKSIPDWKNELKGHLTRLGWRLVAEADAPAVFLEVLPPASEAVGNERGYEVTRFDFTATETKIRTYAAGSVESYDVYRLGFPAYNYENTVTINGAKITTGAVGYSDDARSRTQKFYAALMQYRADNPGSGLAKLEVTQNISATDATQGSIILRGTAQQKTITLTANSGVDAQQMRAAYTPKTAAAYSQPLSVTHDFASGFVYYLSVHSRKIELATKTTSAFYGPIGVQYVDNAAALAAVPSGLTPIEAVTYSTEMKDFGDSARPVRLSHVWGIAASNNYGEFNGRHAELYTGLAYITGMPLADRRTQEGGAGSPNATALGLHQAMMRYVMPPGVTAAALAVNPVSTYDGGGSGPATALAYITPGLPMPDVFIATADSTNESLHLGRVVTDVSALVGLTSGGLEVADGAKFPSAGVVIVDSEIIKYTAKNGNVLTGLTRAAYATAQAEHAAGAAVYPAMWFVKINGGMMTAGYVKPGEAAGA